jgi:hypothetical protein
MSGVFFSAPTSTRPHVYVAPVPGDKTIAIENDAVLVLNTALSFPRTTRHLPENLGLRHVAPFLALSCCSRQERD